MDLSYVWTPVAAMAAELFDFGGEPPGTRTQGPRLKSTTTAEENQCDDSSEPSNE
jgi:hypothetical protein